MKAMMVFAAGLMAVVIATPSSAEEYKTFEQLSYSVGYKVGKSLKAGQGELNLDIDIVKQAITDVMTDAPLKLTEEQMKAAFTELQARRQAGATKPAK
jgi:FKBP-type peptidyl-prolyl cis-trans isomerase